MTERIRLSDNGSITGYMIPPDGRPTHALLLTPVPGPSSLVLLATGAVGLLGYYTARRRARPST